VVGKLVELVVVEEAAVVVFLGWRRWQRWWENWAVGDKFLGEAPDRQL
jgi:hypothetical protein